MSLNSDIYEERRRKWRRSGFWKGVGLTLGVLIGGSILLGVAFGDQEPTGPYIAKHYVLGTIFNDPDRDQLIADLAEDRDARALILYVESPGGTTVGAEGIFDAIRHVAAEKPVVAVMGEVAASGGYIASIAADHVIARGNTLTGSIGVILEYPDVSGLLDRIGVEVQTVRSSDVKGGLSPLRPASEEELDAQRELIADAHNWFRGLVEERRQIEGDALNMVADGRAFTGRQALDVDLVDQIGGLREAESWLEQRDSRLDGLPIRVVSLPEPDLGWLDYVGNLSGFAEIYRDLRAREGFRLFSTLR